MVLIKHNTTKIIFVLLLILFTFGIGIWGWIVYNADCSCSTCQCDPSTQYWLIPIVLWLVFNLVIIAIYCFRKILITPFIVFWQLSFERKMLLLITFAIFMAVSFYSWSIWDKHKYREEQGNVKEYDSLNLWK